MPAASEAQQTLDRFAPEIADLKTIARLHGLPTGSPEHLVALPYRLAKDVRLRSDITELVRVLQQRDPELGLADVLSLLQFAVGGALPGKPSAESEEALDLTGGFLASLGGWPGSLVEPLTDIDNPPDHDPRLDLTPSADPQEGNIPSRLVEEVTAPAATSPVEQAPAADAAEALRLAQITEALARLERGNLELRLHLDSIDQRICRMEPILESVPHGGSTEAAPVEPVALPEPNIARATAKPEPPRRLSLSAEAVDPQQLKEQRRSSLSSSFPSPAAAAAAPTPQPILPLAAVTPDAPAVSALGNTEDPVSRPRTPVVRRDRFAAARELPGNPASEDFPFAASEEIAAFAEPELPPLTQASPHQQEEAASLRQLDEQDPPLEPFATPQEPVAPVESQISAESAPEYIKLPADTPVPPRTPEPWIFSSVASRETSASLLGEPARKSRAPWIAAAVVAASVLGSAGFLYVNGLPAFVTQWLGGESTPLASSAPAESPASTASAAAPPSPAYPVRGTQSTPSRSRSARAGAAETASSSRLPGARESYTPSEHADTIYGPTFVPGPVMDSYLVSAPRPLYPKIANLVDLEGKISMEAMISKSGEIEALKVLGGPHLLRDAASNAVRQWRYRPFLVNGQPVEVRTIIRVDVAPPAAAPTNN